MEIGEISVKSDHEIEWTIEDFFCYTEKDECYFSPDFTISCSEWYLKVYPNGETTDNAGWISLYLSSAVDDDDDDNDDDDNDDASPVGATYTFGVKKTDGTVEQIGRETTFVFRNEDHGYVRFLKRSVLLRRKSELAPSDSLTFTCTLRTEKYFESPGNHDTLSRNLADLFTSKEDSDTTLLVKGKGFSVHRAILSARSPVLAAMFKANMREKRTGIVEIEDCDPEAFSVFLTYLYSGKVENGSVNPLELYKIADKYDVQDLKPYCRMSIMVNLSVENFLDVVFMGRQFRESSINLTTQNFFNENYARIIPTAKWAKFIRERADIANELLNGMVAEQATQK